MAPTSPKAGYTLLRYTSEENNRKDQHGTRNGASGASNSLNFHPSSVLRLFASVFSIISIVCLIIGDYRPGRIFFYSRSRGSVAFPLVFLFILLLSHAFAAFVHIASLFVHVEWKRPEWGSHGLNSVDRRRRQRLIAAVDLIGGFFLVGGVAWSAVITGPLFDITIAGVVFASFTAAIHIGLGLLSLTQVSRYRWTLTISPNTDDQTDEPPKSSASYRDMEDNSEQQPLVSTLTA